MAVRFQNKIAFNFGTFGADATVTHFRVQKGTTILTTKTLTTSRAVVTNQQAEFAIGALDLLFPRGEMTDAGMQEAWEAWFDGVITIKLMTSTTAEVLVSGYADKDTTDLATDWTVTTPSD